MEIAEDIIRDMKKKFDANVLAIFNRMKKNTKIFTKEVYFDTIDTIKSSTANNVCILTESYLHYRGQNFDVISMDGVDRLIVCDTQDSPKYYVYIEEMFQIIYDVHLANGHCGRNRMEKEINNKYKNITRGILKTFLSICFVCEQKRPVPQITEKVKPHCSNFDRRFPRCQVNVMEREDNPDGPYKYILVYEDHRTKFVQLRPMKTCTTKEIVGRLLKIFTIFGVPTIMHSDNGREFASEIIVQLSNKWNQVKMVYGRPRSTSLNNDILELIEMWLTKNRTSKWSKCLHYIQLVKNKCHHKEIDGTPYEAMFGSECKIGLSSDDLPMHKMAEMKTENDLQAFLKDNRVETDDSNSGDEGSVEHFEKYLKSLNVGNECEEEDYHENSVDNTMPPMKIMKLSKH